MVGHIHIMIIELLMKLDVILKNVGCTVTKMLDQNNRTILKMVPIQTGLQYPQNIRLQLSEILLKAVLV